MPLGLPVAVLSLVSVVEVHSNCDCLAPELIGYFNTFQDALPDVFVKLLILSVAFPVVSCKADPLSFKLPLGPLLLNYLKT